MCTKRSLLVLFLQFVSGLTKQPPLNPDPGRGGIQYVQAKKNGPFRPLIEGLLIMIHVLQFEWN
jgi:hypothetical protein